MDQPGGRHSQAAIFATDGKVRHLLVRAAVAAGIALLAAWLIALALGVLGGFGSLPGLPGSSSSGSNPASSHVERVQRPDAGPSQAPDLSARRPAEQAEHSVPTSTQMPASHVRSPSRTQSSTPKTTMKAPASPSVPVTTESPSNNGRRLGTTKATTTGKPVGTPGNGPGGSGPPGRLR